MNIVEPCSITCPQGDVDDCASFTIGDVSDPFILSGITSPSETYTISFWLKGDGGNLTVGGKTFTSSTDWKWCSATYKASGPDLEFIFESTGTYYMYHAQLELGNVSTDWAPNPEDVNAAVDDVAAETQNAHERVNVSEERITRVEASIQMLADSIAMLVRNGSGGSLLKQDANGLYYFDISDIENDLLQNASDIGRIDGLVYDSAGRIDVLASTAEALKTRTEYVKSYTDENDKPCLELGEGDSAFKVYITNTEIRFANDTETPAYIGVDDKNVSKLMIEKAEVKGELQIGDFIWQKRANGNVGLMWIGGST